MTKQQSENMNPKFDIQIGELEEKIGFSLNGEYSGFSRVIPLRDIKEVKGMCFFRGDIFEAIVRNVPLRTSNQDKIYPYKNARIEVFGREPKGAEIGQTFVLRSKLLNLMEGLEKSIFSEFVTKGLSKMPPAQIYGLDANKQKAIAFYIPPFIEIHGNHAVIFDGIHRSYLCRSAGTTINAVHLINVEIPLPFEPIEWKNTELTDSKPPVNERYKNLRPEYFRDLSAVGIDG